jgi:hypothetical protein
MAVRCGECTYWLESADAFGFLAVNIDEFCVVNFLGGAIEY